MGEHPIQPIVEKDGVLRFRENALVRFLLDTHPTVDMNTLAKFPCSDEDREQFAQLIGYSLGGFADLHYAREETIAVAYRLAENPEETDDQARAAICQETLIRIREILKPAVYAMYGVDVDE